MKKWLSIALPAALVACGGTQEPQPQQNPTPDTSAPVPQRYVGCIGPTGDANTFILSVSEGRDFTTGEPAGSPIPQASQLPEGAPPPVPPVTATSGTPGGGPAPVTEIVTYTLVGDGAGSLGELVGHTVAIVGTRRDPEDPSRASTSGMLHVESVQNLADYCR
jgi:hypothetical protein